MVKERLERIMAEKGMKVADLAYLSRLSDTAIYNILSGADPRLSSVARLARALKVKFSDLVDESQMEQYLEDLENKLETLVVAPRAPAYQQ